MSTLDYSLLYAAAALVVLPFSLYVRSWVEWRRCSGGRPLPPGPPPLPFVGNLFNAPRYKPWIGYRDLCRRYGRNTNVWCRRRSHFLSVHRHASQVTSCSYNSSMGPQPEVINEALDKRSAITSDRKQTLLLRL